MNDADFNSERFTEVTVGADISMYSVDKREKRIIVFEQEISRIREGISAKQISKEAVGSIFRS